VFDKNNTDKNTTKESTIQISGCLPPLKCKEFLRIALCFLDFYGNNPVVITNNPAPLQSAVQSADVV